MSLYPTPTRIALLRDVDACRVVGHHPAGHVLLSPDAKPLHVTERIREMYRAGWIRPVDHAERGELWELTDLGRFVLDTADADREQAAAEVAAEHFHLSPGDLKGHRR